MSRKEITEHSAPWHWMNENMSYWLDGNGDLMVNNMVKEAYERFYGTGFNLDDIKQFAHEINDIYEGRKDG